MSINIIRKEKCNSNSSNKLIEFEASSSICISHNHIFKSNHYDKSSLGDQVMDPCMSSMYESHHIWGGMCTSCKSESK